MSDETLPGPVTTENPLPPTCSEPSAEAVAGPSARCVPDSLIVAMLDEQYGSMMGTLTPIAEEVTSLREEFAKRLSYDATKEEAFTRLYKELEGYRADHASQRLRPIFLDLILLLDRIEQNHANLRDGTVAADDFSSILQSIHDEVMEVLFRGEVEPIEAGTGKFDPATQRAVALEQTTEAKEHFDVARVVRRGFRYRGRVLRAEEVLIKKLTL